MAVWMNKNEIYCKMEGGLLVNESILNNYFFTRNKYVHVF
jgi:hypothetical protein